MRTSKLLKMSSNKIPISALPLPPSSHILQRNLRLEQPSRRSGPHHRVEGDSFDRASFEVDDRGGEHLLPGSAIDIAADSLEEAVDGIVVQVGVATTN